MKHRLSIDEAWDKCLDMWQWIAEVKLGLEEYNFVSIIHLKIRWLKDNHIGAKIKNDCYFCEYAQQQYINDNMERCYSCPPISVAKRFHCESNLREAWHINPVAFYNKLLVLNKKRLVK